MSYLKIGVQTFYRHLGLSLLMVLQFAIALSIINVLAAQTNAQTQAMQLFSPMASDKGFYVMTSPNAMNIENYQMPDFQKTVPNIKNVSEINEFYFHLKSGIDLSVQAYADDTVSRMPMPLKKGVWFTQADSVPGEVPVVIAKEQSGLKLGDRIQGSVDVLNEKDPSASVPVVFKIVGVLKETAHYLSFSSGGNAVASSDIIKRYYSAKSSNPLVLCQWSKVGLPSNAFIWPNQNKMVFAKDGATTQELARIQEDLGKECYVVSFDQLQENAKKEAKDIQKRMLPFTLSALMISFVGILSSTILHAMGQMKMFGIFFLCGARWKHCFLSYLGYIICLLFLTFLVLFSALFWFWSNGTLREMGLVFSYQNGVYTCATVIGAVLVALLPPYFILKKNQPVAVLRNHE